MDDEERTVWLAFCYWDMPCFIENQQDLLGVFSTRAKAEERLRRHEEYAVTVDDDGFTDPHSTATRGGPPPEQPLR